MARHGILVLAILAALLGAPPVASAAANSLGSPSATPTTGTTDTVFVLRVSYDGQFPAAGVTAVVGPRVLAMSLVAGSATSGTWSSATTLPAGTWPVVYTAVVLQGNAPTLSAVTLSVHDAAPAATPIPATVSNPPRAEAGRESPTSGGDGSAPAPPPAPAPVAATPAATPAAPPKAAPQSPAVAEDADAPAPGAAPEEPVQGPAPSSAPAPAGAGGAPGAEATGGAAGTPTGPPGSTESPRDGVLAGTDAPRPADETAGPVSADEDVLGMVLLLGLSGVAAVALVGSALLALGRRRRTTDDAPRAAEAAVTTDAPLLARRARRLSRTPVDDDPILASLGIGRTARTRKPDPERAKKKDGS